MVGVEEKAGVGVEICTATEMLITLPRLTSCNEDTPLQPVKRRAMKKRNVLADWFIVVYIGTSRGRGSFFYKRFAGWHKPRVLGNVRLTVCYRFQNID